MNKITYLFGAGASCHALPVTNEIPGRLQNLLELLQSEELKLDANASMPDNGLDSRKSQLDFQNELIESLKWMQRESERHASIDTFAKKLSLKKEVKLLKELKLAMSVFFVLEQARKKPDFRYDGFFASILSSLEEFPKNIKILSWNYDYQFEMAFAEYSDVSAITSNQMQLRVKSKFIESNNGYNDSGFCIYKLNGTTGLHMPNNGRQFVYTDFLNVPFDKKLILQVTQSYAVVKYLPSYLSSLSFAWEDESSETNVVNRAISETQDTVALVVIGYSFPFFNREVDRRIIDSMTKLKRVYFQAPDSDILKERFEAIRKDLTGLELIPRHDINQFLLPNEL